MMTSFAEPLVTAATMLELSHSKCTVLLAKTGLTLRN